jgi:hypothetical protein
MAVHIRKVPATAGSTFLVAAMIAAFGPASSARAEENTGRTELQDAVEYFVTLPIRASRDPSRGRLGTCDWHFNVTTSVEYGSSHPDRHTRGSYVWFNETSVAAMGAFDCPLTGWRWSAEIEVARAGDLEHHFHPLNWAYQASMHHNFDVANQNLQLGVFLAYLDGDTLGRSEDAFWAPGVSLSMPCEWGENGLQRRVPHPRGELNGSMNDKFIPSVSFEETASRADGASGRKGRDWDSQVALGYEHPLSNMASVGVTVGADYFHVIEDWSYTARVSYTRRLDDFMSFEVFVLLQRGLGNHEQHAEVVGGAVGFDF